MCVSRVGEGSRVEVLIGVIKISASQILGHQKMFLMCPFKARHYR